MLYGRISARVGRCVTREKVSRKLRECFGKFSEPAKARNRFARERACRHARAAKMAALRCRLASLFSRHAQRAISGESMVGTRRVREGGEREEEARSRNGGRSAMMVEGACAQPWRAPRERERERET